MRQIIFFLMLPLSIFAQNAADTLRQLYDKHTVMVLAEGTMQNAQITPQPTAFFKKDPLMTQLKTVPEAYKSYKKANWNTAGGIGVLSVAMPALMIGLGTLDISKTPSTKTFTYASIGIGTSLSVLSYSILHKGETHYFNALWQYNRAAILRGYPDTLMKEKIGDLYDKKTIRLTGTGFIQNGSYKKRGFYNQHLTPIFADNVLSDRHLKKSKRAAFFYKPAEQIGFFALMYGLGQVLTFDYPHTKTHNRNSLYIMLVGTALTSISIPLRAQTEDHLEKAVWFYNRDILAKN
jgi:hypothetical protein